MRATLFFARACVACGAIPAAAHVLSPFLHPAAGGHTSGPPPTLLARAPTPSDDAPATQPIPIPIPPVPSTLLIRPSAPAATTPLLPPTLHNFTRPTPTPQPAHTDGPRPRSPDPQPASNSIIAMSIALAVVLTLLLCSVLGLLIHYLRHRRAKEPHDVEAPAKRDVPLPSPAQTRLAQDLRDVQRSQVPPRMVGGRDVEMVNREEPESQRRGWQAEYDESMRRERERGGWWRWI